MKSETVIRTINLEGFGLVEVGDVLKSIQKNFPDKELHIRNSIIPPYSEREGAWYDILYFNEEEIK